MTTVPVDSANIGPFWIKELNPFGSELDLVRSQGLEGKEYGVML